MESNGSSKDPLSVPGIAYATGYTTSMVSTVPHIPSQPITTYGREIYRRVVVSE
jgi:hypothetical protein